MQYFIRKELDIGSPINLRRLSPMMKIYVGFMCKWHETKYYKTKYNKRKEAEFAAQTQRDEKLKDVLLAVIYKELNNNESLSERGEECVEVVVQVKSEFIHALGRVLKSKEFLPYVIERVEENGDFRLAYPEMPILLRVRKKAMMQ